MPSIDSLITQSIISSFNNRDVALFIWLLVIAVILARVTAIRESFYNLVKTIFQKSLIAMFLLFLLSTLLSIFTLTKLGFWDYGQTRNSLWWFLGIGFTNIYIAIESRDTKQLRRKFIAINFKALIIIEFIVNIYSFSLIGELLFVPIVTIIVLLQAFTKIKKEYESVHNIFFTLQSFIGFILLFYAVFNVFYNPGYISTSKLFQNFLTPVLLTLLSIPFLLILFIFVIYEKAFLRMSFFLKDQKIFFYSKRKMIIDFNIRVGKVIRFVSLLSTQSHRTEKEIDDLFKLIEKQERKKNAPIYLQAENGWNPFALHKYLDSYEIDVKPYNPLYKSKWKASSHILNTGQNSFKSNISYTFEGTEDYVTLLTLTLRVNSSDGDEESIELLKSMINEIFFKIFDTNMGYDLHKCIEELKSESFEINSSAKAETNFTSSFSGIGYKYAFSIKHKNHKVYTSEDFVS